MQRATEHMEKAHGSGDISSSPSDCDSYQNFRSICDSKFLNSNYLQ
jgi:hypothetical protein